MRRPRASRGLEQRRGGRGEMRAEDQRGGGAVRGERADEFAGDRARVRDVRHFASSGSV